MENCLVKKLKSVVDNNELCRMNELTFIVPKNTNNWVRIDSIAKNGKYMLYTLRGGNNVYFSDSSYSENYGKTIRSSDNLYIKNSSSEDAYLVLEDMYLITKLFAWDHQGDVRLSELFEDGNFLEYLTIFTELRIQQGNIDSENLKNCNSLTVLKLIQNAAAVNLDDIKGITSIQNLYLYSCKLLGNISLLDSMINMTSLQISYCTGTSGTLESLLEGLLSNGKTSDLDCFIYGNTNEITFNGVKTQTKHYICSFSTNSISVSVDNVVIATYNGSTWTYNS